MAQYELGRQAGALLPKEKNLAEQARLEKALGYYDKVERGKTLLGRRAQGLPSDAGENLTLQATEDSDIGSALEFQEMLVLNTQAAQRQNLVLASTQDARSTDSSENATRQSGSGEPIRPPRPLFYYRPGDFDFLKQAKIEYDREAGAWADAQLGFRFNHEYLNQIQQHESKSFGYHAIGNTEATYRALGIYQMLPNALNDTGFVKRVGKSSLAWTEKLGIRSAQEYLQNTRAQELGIRELFLKNESYLKSNGSLEYIGKKVTGVLQKFEITLGGLVAGAHRRGAKKVIEYLDGLQRHNFDTKALLETLTEEEAKIMKEVETRVRDVGRFPYKDKLENEN